MAPKRIKRSLALRKTRYFELMQVFMNDLGEDRASVMWALSALVNYYGDDTCYAHETTPEEIVTNYEMLNEWLIRDRSLRGQGWLDNYEAEKYRLVSDLKKINVIALVQFVKKKATDAGDWQMIKEVSHDQIVDMMTMISKEKKGRLKWLDIDSGTGELAMSAYVELHGVDFTLCDPSEEKLLTAKEKLKGKSIVINPVTSDALQYENEFDVVTDVQSHQWYDIETREIVVNNCHRALKEGGIFMTFKDIRMSTEESYAITAKRWKKDMIGIGMTPEGVDDLLAERREKTFPLTIEQHLEILKKAGFKSVDILWVSNMQAGFWAIK